jgi:hypothetical protein
MSLHTQLKLYQVFHKPFAFLKERKIVQLLYMQLQQTIG